ncbi:hypothetical protein INT45_013326 [Circinella minor]|uniref:Uncharacterized protein n=1 Tax=Circinella minor TaxID=1195481 RepID=A0A8H7VFA9_9FUNG|nr:hypothetical protein INT45_013326 [Circinella minor]
MHNDRELENDHDPLLGSQRRDNNNNDNDDNITSFTIPLKPRQQDDYNNTNNNNNNNASGSRHSNEENDDDDDHDYTNQEERRLLDTDDNSENNNNNDNNEQRPSPEPMEVRDSDDDARIRVSKWDNPIWRYTLLAIFLAMFLIMFKIVLVIIVHSEMIERGPDRVLFNGTEYFDPLVVLVSLDGFQENYLHRNITPNLVQFASNGMRAEYMHPAFPSVTFPNHWTLATGLHPESHGIVANEFYDPILKKDFSIQDDDARWWKGEPIWMTAKRQEKESALIMWPGSFITGLKPERVIPFNDTMPAIEKMDIALNWIDLPRHERPNFIGVYIQQIDEKGHQYGPEGSDINKAIKDMDQAIGHLWDGLAERNLLGRIHIVIVSDHGMAEVDRSRVIYYDDILSSTSKSYLREREAGPLLGLRPKEDAPKHAVQQIYQELYNYTQTHPEPHFQVYLRDDVPIRLHYNHNERIAPIVAIPDVGYVMVDHKEWHPTSSKEPFTRHGIHGYDNLAKEMRSIFIAYGPVIDSFYGRRSVVAPFFNTEVYGFVCELLNIESNPIQNGTMSGQFVRIR